MNKRLLLYLLDVIGDLALSESLIEAFAQSQIGLTLGTLQELLHFPAAGTLILGGLSTIAGIVLLMSWGSRGGSGLGNLLIRAATEHASDASSNNMTLKRRNDNLKN